MNHDAERSEFLSDEANRGREDLTVEIRLEDMPDIMQEGARRMGWTSLMPVQAKAIPYLRAGRDLMVQSRTGTGKTAAFLFPILERLDPERAECQALVLQLVQKLRP